MVVKIIENISFPRLGWLSHKALGPQNGRCLVEVRAHSGSSSWAAGLLTIPEAALGVEEHHRQYGDAFLGGVEIEHFYHILPGTYEIQEGQDKRGQRLLRFYPSTAEPEFVLFHARGHIVQQASSPETKAMLECQGRSRTGRNGDRWGSIHRQARFRRRYRTIRKQIRSPLLQNYRNRHRGARRHGRRPDAGEMVILTTN